MKSTRYAAASCCVILFILLQSPPSLAYGARPLPPEPVEPPASESLKISDSLVQNLACSEISQDSVMAAIRPDAFSVERQLPIKNWSAPFDMAECWSLSHFQRMLFFMGRFGSQVDLSAVYLGTLTDTAKGLNDFYPEVFPVTSSADLLDVMHDFKKDIEHYQDWRFTQLGNIEFILGERDRSPKENQRTFEKIQWDLPRGRKPLIVIRAEITWQHVVMIKSMTQVDSDTFRLTVYDSNRPDQENTLDYKVGEREFYAPLILSKSLRATRMDIKDPVGVFIVDEHDMDNIERSLFDYYKGLCDRAN